MPSREVTPTLRRSSALHRRSPSSQYKSSPPPDVCAKINSQVRSNPALDCPHFDFAAHVSSRVYTIHNYVLNDFEGVALLDEGVENLLPHVLESIPEPASLSTFEIAHTEKKGLGMVALMDISADDLILVEHPLIVVPYVIGLTKPLSEVYAALFDRLEPKACRDLMSLANSKSVEECSLLEGIVRTNAIGIQLDVPKVSHPELNTHRAVFVNMSRCNHSCGPNARWVWDTATFSIHLTAVRPIRRGEEITIQYTSATQPRSERQAYLRSLYNFTCRCPYCSLPTEPASRSDEARIYLDRFSEPLPTFEEWCMDGSMPDDALIRPHLRALDLIEQEGLEVLGREKHVDTIAMCYGALGDVRMFWIWTRAVRHVRAKGSPEEGLVFAKWMSNPMAFPAWGWRKNHRRYQVGR